jgi:hypothetical protein
VRGNSTFISYQLPISTVFSRRHERAQTANTLSNAEIYIPSYLVSQNKPISGFSNSEDNATTACILAVAVCYGIICRYYINKFGTEFDIPLASRLIILSYTASRTHKEKTNDKTNTRRS